jgi:hypothetical protein
MKMKKLLIGLCIVGVVGYAGYKYGMNYVSGKVMASIADQILEPQDIEQLKKDPEVRKVIEESLSAGEVSKLYAGKPASTPAAGSAASPVPTKAAVQPSVPAGGSKANSPEPAAGAVNPKVMSKDEALAFMLKKFSMGELKSLADQAKDGLTDSEKTELHKTLMSKLTPAEFEAVKRAAIVELLKKDAN